MQYNIRQLAKELNVSPTHLSKTIKNIEITENISIGLKQGKGKPRLLTQEEVDVIKFYLGIKNNPTSNMSMVVYEPTLEEELAIYPVIDNVSLKISDKDNFIEGIVEGVFQEIEILQNNKESIDAANLIKSAKEGALRAAKEFQAEERAYNLTMDKLRKKKLEN